jgi:hypothetical protein
METERRTAYREGEKWPKPLGGEDDDDEKGGLSRRLLENSIALLLSSL